ncbi:hypothetical protein A2U01_0103203, partial [Trifolium medium]|nr:hypothetical protein [Trifolium medium]
ETFKAKWRASVEFQNFQSEVANKIKARIDFQWKRLDKTTQEIDLQWKRLDKIALRNRPSVEAAG